MKVTVLQQDILPVLQSVSRSAGAKNLPVLANVLICAKKGQLELSATNLELGVVKSIKVDTREEGSVTVPARTFLEIVQSLPGGELELNATSDQLKILAANFSASLNGIASSEFPQIPLLSEQSILVDASLLEESLPQITFAAASDEGRPVLTGILTEIKKGNLELVATDGFRLAHKTAVLRAGDGVSFRSLIPKRTFEEVLRLISEDTGSAKERKMEISTSENQNQMVFKIGSTLVSSRLIEGQFPSWEKIIPADFIGKVTLDRAEAVRAVKLASVFARSESNLVKLETKPEKVVFTSDAKQLGEQETDVKAKTEGEAITIAFNSKYLLDALNACPGSEAVIHFSGPLSPALIKPTDDKDLEFLVMPIRLS